MRVFDRNSDAGLRGAGSPSAAGCTHIEYAIDAREGE